MGVESRASSDWTLKAASSTHCQSVYGGTKLVDVPVERIAVP